MTKMRKHRTLAEITAEALDQSPALADVAGRWGRSDAVMADLLDLLRRARKASGRTQQQVAADLGVSQASVSRFESGAEDVSLRDFVAMAEASGHRVAFALVPEEREAEAALMQAALDALADDTDPGPLAVAMPDTATLRLSDPEPADMMVLGIAAADSGLPDIAGMIEYVEAENRRMRAVLDIGPADPMPGSVPPDGILRMVDADGAEIEIGIAAADTGVPDLAGIATGLDAAASANAARLRVAMTRARAAEAAKAADQATRLRALGRAMTALGLQTSARGEQ